MLSHHEQVKEDFSKKVNKSYLYLLRKVVSVTKSENVKDILNTLDFGLLISEIAKQKKAIDEYNYFLLCQYVRALSDLVISEAMQADIENYCALIKTRKLFARRDQELKKIKSHLSAAQFEKFQQNYIKLKSSFESISKDIPKTGFAALEKWLNSSAKILHYLDEGVGLNLPRVGHSDSNNRFTPEMKEELISIFAGTIQTKIQDFPWDVIYEKLPQNHMGMDRQLYAHGLFSKNDLLFFLTKDSKSLSELKANLNNKIFTHKTAVETYEKNSKDRVEPTFPDKNAFKAWFENYLKINKSLTSCYNDIELKKLFDGIVADVDVTPWELTQDQIEEICAAADRIKNSKIKNEVIAKLKRFYVRQSVHQDIAKNSTDKYVPTAIAHPLSWIELKTLLVQFQATTELQYVLKEELLDYISKQESFFAHVVERIDCEYLIKSLYLAKALETDENTLINKFGSGLQTVGMSYILGGKTSDNLRARLNKINTKINSGAILFSQSVTARTLTMTTHLENNQKKDLEKSPSELFQLYWAKFSKFTNSKKSVIDKEAIKNLNDAIYYLVLSELHGHKRTRANLSTTKKVVIASDFKKTYHAEYLFHLNQLPPTTLVVAEINNILTFNKEIKAEADKRYLDCIEINCVMQNETYHLAMTAAELISNKQKSCIYIDSITGKEIARFQIDGSKIIFHAHGNKINLKIDGDLSVSHFGVENENSHININANLSGDSIYLSSNADSTTWNGNIHASQALRIDAKDTLTIAEKSSLSAETLALSAYTFSAQGSIHTKQDAQLKIKESFEQGHQSKILSNKILVIEANNFTEVKGTLSSDGFTMLKAEHKVYLTGNANVSAKSGLLIQAQSLLSNRNATVKSAELAYIQIEDNLLIEEKSNWSAGNINFIAKVIENYSPNLEFDRAKFEIKDKLVIHASGVIKTKTECGMRGESVWNRGTLNYGKKLNVQLNKAFVNGLANAHEIYECRKDLSSLLQRAQIIGEDATIVTSVYFNLCSFMNTHNLSLTSLGEIQLGALTLSTNKFKSRLIGLDLGVDLPNIPAMLSDAQKFLDALMTGDFESALSQLNSANVFYKTASVMRYLVRTFTSLGKPLDLIWTTFSILMRFPDLCAQLANILQKNKVETYEYTQLLNTINSIGTQASYLQSETVGLADSLSSVHLQSVPFSASTALEILALVFPINSTNSLLQLQSGLHVGFTTINRSLISLTNNNINIDLNRTDMSYHSMDANDLLLADSASAIGHERYSSGTTHVNQDYHNVEREVLNGTTIANTFNSQSAHTEVTEHGRVAAETATFSGEDLNSAGELDTSSLAVDETEEVDLSGREQISHHDDSSGARLHAPVVSVKGEADAAESKFEVDAPKELHLNADINAKVLNLQSALLTIQNHITAEQLHVVTGQAEVNAEIQARTAYFLSAMNLILAGKFSGDTLEIIAAAADLAGSFTETHLTAQAGSFTSTAHLQMRDISIDTTNDARLSGTEQADSLRIAAAGKASVEGKMEAKTVDVSASNVKFSGAEHVKSLRVAAAGSVSLDGKMEAKSLDVNAGDNINETGSVTIDPAATPDEKTASHGARFSAGNAAHLTGPLDAADAPIEVIAVNSAIVDGPVTGDTLIVEAQAGSVAHVNVDNLALKFDHIPAGVEDLLLGVGIYSDVHARTALAIDMKDGYTFNRDLDLNYSLYLTANDIRIAANLHTTGDFGFTATHGDVHEYNHNIYADRAVYIDASDYFINDQGNILSTEMYLNAGLHMFNNAGMLAASNYLQMNVGGNIYNSDAEQTVRGRYDDLIQYTPGRIVGGMGIGHDGIGLSMQANSFYNTASEVLAVGSIAIKLNERFESVDRTHRYIDYKRDYHNGWGHSSHTVEYAYEQARPVVYSLNGEIDISVDNGSLYSRSTQFYAGAGTNIHTRYDQLYEGSVLSVECFKSSSNIYGLSRRNTDQYDEYTAPTEVISRGNEYFLSDEGDVRLMAAFVQTQGFVGIQARRVEVSAPIENHSYTEETRGFSLNLPILSYFQSQPLVQDYHAFQNGKNPAEWTVDTWNTLIDSTNMLNSMISTYQNGGPTFKGSLETISRVEIGYTVTRTTAKWQTVANNVGIDAGSLSIVATSSITFNNGVTIKVAGDAFLQAPVINQYAAKLISTLDSSSESVSVGINVTLKPDFSASASGFSQSQTTYQNQHLYVGGTLTVNAVEVNMIGANDTAKTVVMKAKTLNMETLAGTSTSQSWSLSACTTGDFSAAYTTNRAARVNEVTSIISDTGDITLDTLNTVGGVLVARNGGQADIKTINASSVKQYDETRGASLSGNVHSFNGGKDKSDGNSTVNRGGNAHAANGGNDNSGGITTVNPGVAYKDYQADQKATVFGYDVSKSKVNGDLNTKDASGLEVKKDASFNVVVKVPTDMSQVKQTLNNDAHPSRQSPTNGLYDFPEEAETKNFEVATTDLPDQKPEQPDQPVDTSTLDVKDDDNDDAEDKETKDEPKDNSKDKPKDAANTPIYPTDAPAASSPTSNDYGSQWAKRKTAYYANTTFSQSVISQTKSSEEPAERKEDKSDKEIFEKRSSNPELDIGIPDPRFSNVDAFGRNYYPSMPVGLSADYATAKVKIFEEDKDFKSDDYDSESKFVNDPRSAELDLSKVGFHSGTRDYLDQIKLAQSDSAVTAMTYSKKSTGDTIKDDAAKVFKMDNVEAFNEGVEAARDGLVSSIVHLDKTVESIALGGWDALNGISEEVSGLTTEGSHERNIERGKALHETVEHLENGTVADDIKVGTEIVAGAIFGEAVGVAVLRTGETVWTSARNLIEPEVTLAEGVGELDPALAGDSSQVTELAETNELTSTPVQRQELSIGHSELAEEIDSSLTQVDEAGFRPLEDIGGNESHPMSDFEELPNASPIPRLDLPTSSIAEAIIENSTLTLAESILLHGKELSRFRESISRFGLFVCNKLSEGSSSIYNERLAISVGIMSSQMPAAKDLYQAERNYLSKEMSTIKTLFALGKAIGKDLINAEFTAEKEIYKSIVKKADEVMSSQAMRPAVEAFHTSAKFFKESRVSYYIPRLGAHLDWAANAVSIIFYFYNIQEAYKKHELLKETPELFFDGAVLLTSIRYITIREFPPVFLAANIFPLTITYAQWHEQISQKMRDDYIKETHHQPPIPIGALGNGP